MHPEIEAAYQQRLHHLRVKAAMYGLDTPPHVLMEIEDIEGLLKKPLLLVFKNLLYSRNLYYM